MAALLERASGVWMFTLRARKLALMGTTEQYRKEAVICVMLRESYY